MFSKVPIFRLVLPNSRNSHASRAMACEFGTRLSTDKMIDLTTIEKDIDATKARIRRAEIEGRSESFLICLHETLREQMSLWAKLSGLGEFFPLIVSISSWWH